MTTDLTSTICSVFSNAHTFIIFQRTSIAVNHYLDKIIVSLTTRLQKHNNNLLLLGQVITSYKLYLANNSQ